jgi:transcriptional regulator of acetoin/glycerol metabolism
MRVWATEGTMLHAERQALLAALEYTGYNIKRSAERLQISRSTAYRLIEELEIQVLRGSPVGP